MKLNKFQENTARLIFQQADEKALALDLSNYADDEREARLAVYRNNTFYSLIAALKDLYPSLVITVGEDYFAAIAREYLLGHPPTEAAMVSLAPDFPKFLSSHQSAGDFAYLSDLAKLDLLRHQSYHAADESPLAAEVFSQMEVDEIIAARIQPMNSARLLKSDFAIFDIWQLAHDSDKSTRIDAQREQYLLIIRPEFEVEMFQLNHCLFNFLNALSLGQTISDSLASSMELDKNFEASHAISFLIQSHFSTKIIGDSK